MKQIVFGLSLLLVMWGVLGCSDSSSGSDIGSPGEGGGFVWKPRAESDGRLVVLLPAQYRGKIKSAHIANASGDVIEVGRFAGDTHNGRRPHYRFTQHGSGYGDGIYVVADLSAGGKLHWFIARGASRQVY